MTSLLAIEVSPRFDYSVSRKLTAQFIKKWKATHPTGSVVIRDLMKTHLPFVDFPWIGGAFMPAEQHSPEMKAAIKVSNDLIAELKAADHIVIGTPMYNFSIPAALKAYIDHVVRLGVTFTMQYEGLLTGKKATIILVSGGNFAPGSPTESYNVATSYLRQILGFIGITDVTVALAGQTLAVGQGGKTMDEFAAQFDKEISAAAAH
jgi:FMN-dependent NADH-azoreductase